MDLKSENVWDYPRPPACETHKGTIEVIINDKTLAKTKNAMRIIETSHPPTYYFPIENVKIEYLRKNSNTSFCEWKGIANYFDLKINETNIADVAWYYSNPSKKFLGIKNQGSS